MIEVTQLDSAPGIGFIKTPNKLINNTGQCRFIITYVSCVLYMRWLPGTIQLKYREHSLVITLLNILLTEAMLT